MNNLLLWEIEKKYYEKLDDAVYTIENGCTLEEFLDLGFNNATLMNPFEEDTDEKDITDLYTDVNYITGEKKYHRDDLTDEMLNCEVELSSTYQDGDGYTCATIVLKNEDDWKYFKDIEG